MERRKKRSGERNEKEEGKERICAKEFQNPLFSLPAGLCHSGVQSRDGQGLLGALLILRLKAEMSSTL